jgi:pseudouridine-5'-phosphate glycosidase
VSGSLFICRGPIADALAACRPVVALETTLVTHGLPHPDGLETAMALEDDVRRGGAIPATIGILRGAIRVGLDAGELDELAAGPDVAKTNLSNLGAIVASGRPGSTTVAATMFAAHAAGIRVFATGGIGGVHRDVELSGDVSADLTALSRIPVAVVCAGAKAILDLPRTVEMLETLGVPVFGLRTGEFPAFYRRSSGLPVDRGFDSVDDLARAVQAHFQLNLGTGVVIASPIPPDDEMAEAVYERSLGTALAEARDQGLRGRAVTPFLLERMRTLTGGASLRANVALLRNNARVAAQLAVAMAQQSR